ncbi:hypothetical protein A6C57_23305 [Fibrella sp. ES10-3-2-2]|nr:hypothetical protein A6C57_23305 [Fibrella sp. ES10-3-2-2]
MTTELDAPIEAAPVDEQYIDAVPVNQAADNKPVPITKQVETIEQSGPLTIPIADIQKLKRIYDELPGLLAENEAIAADENATREQLHVATMKARNSRTDADKLVRKAAAPFGQVYDVLLGFNKEIATTAKQAEVVTMKRRDDLDEAEKKRKIAEAKAAAEKVSSRIASLMRLGAIYEAGDYILGEVVIENIEVQAATDEDWQATFTLAVTESETIAARKREEEAAKQREAEALEVQRKEQEAERLRLKALADEQQRIADEQRVAMEKQQAEIRQQVLDMRLELLTGLGWESGNKRVWYTDFANYLIDAIAAWPAAHFSDVVAEFRAWQAEAAAKAEAQRVEQEAIAERERQLSARFRQRSAELVALGWVWDEEGDVCSHGQAWSITLEDLRDIEDEGFDNLLAGFRQWVINQAEAAKQAEADAKAQQKANKEQAKRLAKDKNLFHKWVLADSKLVPPVFENPELLAYETAYIQRRQELAQEFLDGLVTL